MGNNVYGKGLYDGLMQGKAAGRKEAAIVFLAVTAVAQIGTAIWRKRQEQKAQAPNKPDAQP